MAWARLGTKKRGKRLRRAGNTSAGRWSISCFRVQGEAGGHQLKHEAKQAANPGRVVSCSSVVGKIPAHFSRALWQPGDFVVGVERVYTCPACR